MAIKRWNANTSTWELVGTPGTVTPAAIGAAALVGGNTFTSIQRINGRLAIQSTGDRQVDFLGQDGNTYAYIGTTGAIGNTPANSLKIRSDAGGIVFGYQGFEQARIDTSGNVGVGTSSPTSRLHVETSGANYITSRNNAVGAGIAGFICQNSGDTRGMHINGSTLHLYDYSAGASRLAIDASGKVGIGTTSPSAGLHVSGQAADGGGGAVIPLKITNTGTTTIFNWATGSMAPNLTNGQGIYHWFGQAESTLNSAGIGYRFVSSGSTSNAITFSHYASNNLVSIDGNGGLLVGYTTTNNTAYKLQVNSQIFATSSSIATSDGRYKENVLPITSGLDIIDSLNPVSFNWKEHPVHNFVPGKTVGFIAQEVKEALKDYEWVDNIIKTNYNEELDEEFLGIAESNIIPLLVAAVKELRAEVNTLKAQVNN